MQDKIKKEAFMCIAKNVTRFLKNGANVLREASRGEYSRESEDVTRLKHEMFSVSDDKTKLRKDKENVTRDVRNAWEKLKLTNG